MVHHVFTPNPYFNLFASILLAFTGNFIGSVTSIEIPVIIMQFFQILAWFSAFVVMLVTLYKTFKKDKTKEKTDE